MAADDGVDDLGPLGETERAILGDVTPAEVLAVLSAWTGERLGSAIEAVVLRAGRIDAVWGVRLTDGRLAVVKALRQPVDLEARRAAVEAQQELATAGFPCPVPLAGPDRVDGRVLTAETMVPGLAPDGRAPGVRRLLAEGLHRHVRLLAGRRDLIPRAGPGPSWCRYADGPWPTPHDTLVDLGSTPAGFGWLDRLAAAATEQVLQRRRHDPVVLGHADWYAGNVTVARGRLVGTVDWELVADTEAVIAGFAAACYGASASAGGGLSSPPEIVGFLQDYERSRGTALSGDERAVAVGAATWILAFNARWQVGLMPHGLADQATIDLVRTHQDDLLGLSWD